jgi:hypothetical protein
MTRSSIRLAACAAVCGVAAAAAGTSTYAQRVPQQADVIVVDRNNNPVTDLTVGDFIVREDGVAREVSAVGAGGPPSPVVLLIDNSQAAEPAIADLRKGLTSFVTALGAGESPVQIGLRTFGERPTKVADPTTGSVVQLGIDRLFHRAGAGAHMLEAIVETTNDLVKAGAVRPAIVAFVVESGPEFSQDDRPRVAQALQRAGATLWVVVLQARSGALVNTPENRERSAVIGDGTVESGGLNIPVLSPQGITQAFERIRTLFASRVRITYARPDTLVPPETLEITTRREGLRVLAPRWTGGR